METLKTVIKLKMIPKTTHNLWFTVLIVDTVNYTAFFST